MNVNEQLRAIVGSKNVIDDEELLKLYARDNSFVQPIRPRCILKPRSVEEVQRIVNWANSTLTPLVPVSSGEPHFKGDTVPSIGGAVIVDLSGMKKIIRVDRRNRVAIIEPGVTFNELISGLSRNDLAPFMPLLPRNTKSVVGSYLEREPVTMPRHHWDSQDPLLCMELVLGSGDLFRTGSAAGPGTLEEQWEVGRAQVRPMGPSQMDPARYVQGSQGSLGIVTWISLKCRIMPKMKKAFFVPSDKLDKLVDFTYKILWKRLGEDCFILNSTDLACIISKDKKEIGKLSDKLPPWILFWSVEGIGLYPEERVDYQVADFEETAGNFDLKPNTSINGIGVSLMIDLLSKASEEPYWKTRLKGGFHDIFFISTMDKHGSFISEAYEIARENSFSSRDIGIYIQPTVQGTNCHFEFTFNYSPDDENEVEQIKAIDNRFPRQAAINGAFFSMPYGSWVSVAYGPSPYMVIAQRTIKETYDPNKIMNPGKLCF